MVVVDYFNKLAVGTVQFGIDYGISNPNGRTDDLEVQKIVSLLLKKGVTLFDTAPAYGSSESILGETFTCLDRSLSLETTLRVVSKTCHLDCNAINLESIEKTKQIFFRSLTRLQSQSIYGLLIHRSQDLFKKGSLLYWRELQQLKSSNYIQKLGVSVYRIEEAEAILAEYDIDMIQIPFNLFDQRFAESGLLSKFKQKGIEVHSRSTFLQGLLLMSLDRISSYFDPIKPQLQKWHQLLHDCGLLPIEAALAFVLQQALIDSVVVGACNVQQWQQILALAEMCNSRDMKINQINMLGTFARSQKISDKFINPSKWALG